MEDLPAHPVLGDCVDRVAAEYDRLYNPEELATSPLMAVPRSAADLRSQIPELHASGLMAHVTYTSIMTLITAGSELAEVAPEIVERIQSYVADAQKGDLRITQCITDAKGDRSRSPGKQDDPDAYLRVVDRARDAPGVKVVNTTYAPRHGDLRTFPVNGLPRRLGTARSGNWPRRRP
ncbi:MAG: 4-hydroxyphenylacetate 3-hydroxylase N-terminal domain-containing protein [Acidimicrobiales bacterium]